MNLGSKGRFKLASPSPGHGHSVSFHQHAPPARVPEPGGPRCPLVALTGISTSPTRVGHLSSELGLLKPSGTQNGCPPRTGKVAIRPPHVTHKSKPPVPRAHPRACCPRGHGHQAETGQGASALDKRTLSDTLMCQDRLPQLFRPSCARRPSGEAHAGFGCTSWHSSQQAGEGQAGRLGLHDRAQPGLCHRTGVQGGGGDEAPQETAQVGPSGHQPLHHSPQPKQREQLVSPHGLAGEGWIV